MNPAQIHSLQTWVLMVLLMTGYALVLFCYNHLIFNETVLSNYYQEFLSEKNVQRMIEYRYEKSWVSYLLAEALVLFKLLLVSSMLLAVGLFFQVEAGFATLFKLVGISEFLLIFTEWGKIVWFIWHDLPYKEIMSFSPLSLAALLDLDRNPIWRWHLLSSLNGFEVLYCGTLAFLFSSSFGRSFGRSLLITALGYGCSLILWLSLACSYLFYAG